VGWPWLAEIGGAWLVWQGVREHRGLAFVGAGILALGLTASWPAPPAWGMLVDGFRPDRYDLVGAALCLSGVAVTMYAPRPN
jgi:small multidrug resistance family-3 protein